MLKEHLPAERGEWTAAGSAEERELLERYVALTEAGDARGIKALMHEDARFSMPPEDGGATSAATRSSTAGSRAASARRSSATSAASLTRANRQPAVVNYVRKPGADEFRLFAIDVLRIEDGLITDITAFFGPALNAVRTCRVRCPCELRGAAGGRARRGR